MNKWVQCHWKLANEALNPDASDKESVQSKDYRIIQDQIHEDTELWELMSTQVQKCAINE